MKRLLRTLPLFALLIALGSGCIIADNDSSLTIENDSSYSLYEIYIADISAPTWGPDLLGSDILVPGDSFTVLLDCGDYDALVVDEYGVECELHNLDLCFDDEVWVVDNYVLDLCAF